MGLDALLETYKPEIGVIGCNFRTLSVSGREVLAQWRASAEEWLQTAVAAGRLAEAALISTCNRFEVIVAGAGAAEHAHRELAQRVPAETIYAHRNRDAVRHLYRVAASLDSLVVGESQILGQVKASYERAQELGLVRKYLHHLFQGAFSTAKRVRTHTEVADYGVSVSYVAVQLARQMFGPLTKSRAAIIGSGEVAELVALHLGAAGCTDIIVANRTIQRASELAARCGGLAVPLEEIPRLIREVDIIVGSISIDRPILEAKTIRAARRARPLFLIDLGVPRNFSEAVRSVPGVYLAGVDDLATIADRNRALREEAALEAGVVIDYGVHQFERWLQRVENEPSLLSLREQVRVIVAGELAEVGVTEEQGHDLVRRVTERITHAWMTRGEDRPIGHEYSSYGQKPPANK